MTNKEANKASEILDELESIKSLLDDENLDDIPVLEVMIDDTSATGTSDKDPLDVFDQIPTLNDPSVLPNQQRLFDEPAKERPAKEQKRTNLSNDNPFLPKHIRERLGATNDYMQELEQQQRELEKQSLTMPFSSKVPSMLEVEKPLKKPSPSLKSTIANPDDLIDSLVQQYLPIIETELRQRLKKLTEQS